MIRVTIDILPRGDEAKARRVGVVEIANVSEGEPEIASYSIAVDGRPRFGVYGHVRADGIWELLSRVFVRLQGRMPR